MSRRLLTTFLLLLLALPAAAAPAPRVELETTLGAIVIELAPQRAPRTVANFLEYVRDGFYDGTIFHRVIPGFVLQGGGFTADFERKPTRPPIPNESSNGLKNARGTISMARTPDPNSATSQFFINLVDNPNLDFRDKTWSGWGYAVFGHVVQGMDVVDRIGAVQTGDHGDYHDVPVVPVVIRSARILPPAKSE